MESIVFSESEKKHLAQKSWKLIKSNNIDNQEMIALSEAGKKITYYEMFEEWEAYARAFSALNISRENNSRVLVMMPNVASTCYIDYGLNMTGAVCDFIDPTTKAENIEKYIVEEKITDIIALDLIYAQNIKSLAKKLKDEHNIQNIILCHEQFFNGYMPRVIQGFGNIINLSNKFSQHVLRMSDIIRNSKNTPISYDKKALDELSIITHTSGTTTGIGKPIPITDQNRNSLVWQHELAGLVFEKGKKIMHFIPYFAAYGAINSAHLGLCQGMELQQIPMFKPTEFGKLLLENKPNIIFANTPAWMSILTEPSLANADLSFIEKAISGGTPTSPKDEEKINDFLISHGAKERLTKGHGLSELCGCGSYTLDGHNSLGSMGMPMPLNEYRIRNLSSGEIYDSNINGIEGEAYISGPTLTSGILDGKEVVKTVTFEGKRYLPTKDIVKRNINGELFFVDRIDRMFPRYDAYNIYPLNIENIIKKMDFIEDCIIVPQMSEKQNGNVPRIYIKLKNEVAELSDKDYEELVMKLATELFVKPVANTGVTFRDLPEIWTFINEMPKNTMGKNDIFKLKRGEIEGKTIELEVLSNNMGIQKISLIKEEQKKLTLKRSAK